MQFPSFALGKNKNEHTALQQKDDYIFLLLFICIKWYLLDNLAMDCNNIIS